MQAGNLDRRITIQQNTPSVDSYGDEVESWADFKTVWANVKRKSGKETVRSDQTVADASTMFKIRYLSGLHERMRISYNSAIYYIDSIVEFGRQDSMEITATVNNPS
jgi:SPP1 family predicted phage head-tail adaptor